MHAWGHKDLVGMRFGRLLVKSPAGKRGHQRLWECECDCGKIVFHTTHLLVHGGVKSCGCLRTELLKSGKLTRKHGATIGGNDRLYRIWLGMKSRCYISSTASYKYYGARGITVCDEWRTNYAAFAAWAINNGYADHLTIERVNNDGNYTPDNCRWASKEEQNRNKRQGKFTIVDGKKINLSGICKERGISVSLVRGRLDRGWPLEKALTLPVVTHKLTELARKYGINKAALRARLKAGWNLEKALHTPVRKWAKHKES